MANPERCIRFEELPAEVGDRLEALPGLLLYASDDETLNRFVLDTLHLYRDTAPLRRRHRDVLRERMDAWS